EYVSPSSVSDQATDLYQLSHRPPVDRLLRLRPPVIPQGATLSPTIRAPCRLPDALRIPRGWPAECATGRAAPFPRCTACYKNLNQLLPASLLTQPEPGFNEIPKVLS